MSHHTFSLRIPAEVNQALEEICERTHRSKNNLVVVILKEYIRENTSPEPKVGVTPTVSS